MLVLLFKADLQYTLCFLFLAFAYCFSVSSRTVLMTIVFLVTCLWSLSTFMWATENGARLGRKARTKARNRKQRAHW